MITLNELLDPCGCCPLEECDAVIDTDRLQDPTYIAGVECSWTKELWSKI